MSNGRILHLHLGLRFGIGANRQVCNRAADFLKEIERLEAKNPIPLYWNFPVAAVLEKQSRKTADLVSAIRKRIRTGEDRIVPSGFSRAPHPLLLPEELQRELLWCYRNPWFPALRNLFDAKPEAILPVHPDLYSEAVENAYSCQGFLTIGIPIPLYRLSVFPGNSQEAQLKPLAHPDCSIRGANSEARLRPIAVLSPEEVTQKGVDTLLLACGKADALYTMLDLSDGRPGRDSAGPAAVGLLLRLLSRHRQVELHPFSSKTQGSAPTPIDPAELLKFAEPLGRCPGNGAWDQVENLRQKKRKSNLQMRDLLKNIAEAVSSGQYTRSAQGKTGKREPLEITNISMAGSVSLIGIGLQATFSEGRLSNLIDHGKTVLPGEPGRSVFTLDNKRQFLQTNSAFSFDREGQTGLRSILSGSTGKEGERVQIILDYYFADEHSGLALDITASYPILAPVIVSESTPLDLCLCSFSEEDSPRIEVQIPGRDPYQHRVAASPGVFVLSGKGFRLQQGNSVVELLVSRQTTRSEQIEFRIEKKRGAAIRAKASGRPYRLAPLAGWPYCLAALARLRPRGRSYLLWVNLGGSYLPQPAVNLSARRFNLSYAIRFSAAGRRDKRS